MNGIEHIRASLEALGHETTPVKAEVMLKAALELALHVLALAENADEWHIRRAARRNIPQIVAVLCGDENAPTGARRLQFYPSPEEEERLRLNNENAPAGARGGDAK